MPELETGSDSPFHAAPGRGSIAMRPAMWIHTTGGNKGRGRRKKRTKFEMRDECRAPKRTSVPLEQKKIWPTGKLVVSG